MLYNIQSNFVLNIANESSGPSRQASLSISCNIPTSFRNIKTCFATFLKQIWGLVLVSKGTITLIKAIGLKIDGLLNLGDSWSYEYRILRSDGNDRPHKRAEENLQDKNDAIDRQKDEEITNQKDLQAIFDKEKEIAYQSDKKTARNIEKIIAQQREEEVAHHIDKIARQNNVKSAAQIQEEQNHLNLAEKVLRKEAKRLRMEAEIVKKDQRQGAINDYQLHYIHNNKIPKTVTTTAATDSLDSNESKDSDGPKLGTMYMDDETTKKSKTMLRNTKDYSDYTPDSAYSDYAGDLHYSSETSARFQVKDKTRQGDDRLNADASSSNQDSTVNIMSKDNNTTPKSAKQLKHKKIKIMVNKTMSKPCKNKTEEPQMPTKVTTVRTGDIFTDAHEVKNDTKIIEFTNHLYKQTLNIFVTIKEKTNQDHLKDQIDSLAKSYQDKFKEFIKDTSGQKIKTRLGTQKVILNTIDTAFRLLKRLINFMINSLDKKGTLRHNSGTVNRFQKAIETEQKLQSLRACKKFAICRIGPGFSSFLADMMDILLKCDDKKFKQSMDAFTEVVKNLKFVDLLDPDTEKTLKAVIARIERENGIMLKAMVLILKNTMTTQNKPMVVHNYAARSNIVNSTLALFEIIDLLDSQIPRNESNHLEWADMKKSLDEFATGKRHEVQDIMEALFKNIMKNVNTLDASSKKIISRNLEMILSLVKGKFK